MIQARYTASGGVPLLKLEEGTHSLQIQLHYTYGTSPSSIIVEFSIILAAGTSLLESSKLHVPMGEWLIIQLEADKTNQEYTLRIKKYGVATLQGQNPISP